VCVCGGGCGCGCGCVCVVSSIWSSDLVAAALRGDQHQVICSNFILPALHTCTGALLVGHLGIRWSGDAEATSCACRSASGAAPQPSASGRGEHERVVSGFPVALTLTRLRNYGFREGHSTPRNLECSWFRLSLTNSVIAHSREGEGHWETIQVGELDRNVARC
jgi:hypothetical protein